MFYYNFMKFLSFTLAIFILLSACQTKQLQQIEVTKADRKKQVEIITTKGKMIIALYDSTPLHKDNFLLLVKKGFYDSLLFHRVIKDFMIQGGDPDSKKATEEQMLGGGGLSYTIPAEFKPNLFHKKGALSAARTSNPAKASSSCQFYIVQGVVFDDAKKMAAINSNRWPKSITEAQEQIYRKIGGTPHLDQEYTVFGEVVEGLDVLDLIANSPTKRSNRPLENVRILSMKLIKPIKTKIN
jgi:cyclophilin family peptidyl-prolyl cis-trans isomerase